MAKIRVGVVGAGGIATAAHLPAYDAHPNVEISAIADIDAEARRSTADDYSIPARYDSGEEMLSEADIDAVSICTPPNTHRELVTAAAERHIDVFCEKPFATDTEAAYDMQESVTEHGVACQLGYSLRYNNNYRKAARFVRDSLLGSIHNVDIECYVPPPTSAWYYDRSVSGGGIVADRISHWIDYYMWLFEGTPNFERAVLKSIDTTDVEDYARVELTIDDIPISLSLKWVQQGITTSTTLRNTVVGSDGVLEFNRHNFEGNIRGKGMYFKGEQTPTISIGPLLNWWHTESENFMTKPVTSFADDLSSGRPVSGPSVADAVQIMELKSAVYGGE